MSSLLLAVILSGPLQGAPEEQAKGDLPKLPNASVSIPWNELEPLIQRSHGADEKRPPVDYVYSAADYTVTVEGGLARIHAQAVISVLSDEWILVPLGATSAGLKKASLDGAPASLVLRGKDYFVLAHGTGEKKVEIDAESAVTSEAGWQRLTVPLLPSPIVRVSGSIAATGIDLQAARAVDWKAGEQKNMTAVSGIYTGGAPLLWEWRPRVAEDVAGRISADTSTLVMVGDRFVGHQGAPQLSRAARVGLHRKPPAAQLGRATLRARTPPPPFRHSGCINCINRRHSDPSRASRFSCGELRSLLPFHLIPSFGNNRTGVETRIES